jgi:GNAT superfamily N-acetyltransferase
MAHIPTGPSFDRAHLPGAILTFQPGPHPYFANASAVRATDDTLDALVAECTEWFAAHGCAAFTWWLGPSTTPAGLADTLLARGATVLTTGTAMVLDSTPAAGPEIDVREVVSLDGLTAYRSLIAESEALTDDQRAALMAGTERAWADMQGSGGARRCFLAYVDDEPVAAGGLLLLPEGGAVLSGGATRPQARGRGYYRALVSARWEIARDAGRPALLVQASPMSRPVLEGVGFTPVADLTILRQAV